MNDQTCPLKEIPIKGGATLKVNGGFKLQCIGNCCEKYGTCLWKGHGDILLE